MVCPHDKEEGRAEPVWTFFGQGVKRVNFSRFCADVFYERPLTTISLKRKYPVYHNKSLETNCDTLSAPPNSRMQCSNRNASGSICSFQCQAGYTLMGHTNLECNGQFGTWSNEPPMCQSTFYFGFLLSRPRRLASTKSVLITRLLTAIKGKGRKTVVWWVHCEKIDHAITTLYQL